MPQSSEPNGATSKLDSSQRRIVVASYTWLTFDPPLLNLGELLTSRGHHVTAVGISRKEDLSRETYESGLLVARVAYQQANTAFQKVRLAVRYALLLLQVARSVKPTCYVAANWNSFLACSIVRRFVPAPILYYQLEYHGRTPTELTSASIPARLALSLERKLVRGAHTVFSAEPNRSRLMRQDYRLSYTPPSILNAPLQRNHSIETKRESTPKIPRVVYTGSIDEKTCMGALFEALIARRIDAALDLYGTVATGFSKRFDDLLYKARERGNIVNYQGCIPYASVREVLAEYEIGLAFYQANTLNQYYCSPCKLFEYMAAGLAVVTSDFPGIRSIVQPPNLGLCVNSEDPSAIGLALNDLTSRPLRTIKEIGARARQAFLETFAFERQSEPLVRAVEYL